MYFLDEEKAANIRSVFETLGAQCYEIAYEKGFWPRELQINAANAMQEHEMSPKLHAILTTVARLPCRNKGEQIALIHSELSEMLEGTRKPGPDEHLPQFSKEEVEAADTLIRLFDYAYGHNLRLAAAVLAKLAFNAGRPHLHGKQF